MLSEKKLLYYIEQQRDIGWMPSLDEETRTWLKREVKQAAHHYGYGEHEGYNEREWE